MVVKGIFSAELVEANSKTAYKEHAKDGETFVEVEPKSEYFVKVSVGDDRSSNTERKKRYIIRCLVDKQRLANKKIVAGLSTMMGVWDRKGGVVTTTALKFEKPSYELTKGVVDTEPPKMGKVRVFLYEGIQDKKKSCTDGSMKCMNSRIKIKLNGKDDLSKKKAVRSGKGTHEIKKLKPACVMSYKRGQLLETLELNYCTAMGLILVGVLPEPPYWDRHRLEFPASKAAAKDPRLASIQPTITVQKTENSQGQVISQKEMEEYDLTFLSDSDEEGENGNDNKMEAETTTNQTVNGNREGTRTVDNLNSAIVASSVAQEGNHKETDDDNDDGSSSELSVYEMENEEDRVGLEP